MSASGPKLGGETATIAASIFNVAGQLVAALSLGAPEDRLMASLPTVQALGKEIIVGHYPRS